MLTRMLFLFNIISIINQINIQAFQLQPAVIQQISVQSFSFPIDDNVAKEVIANAIRNGISTKQIVIPEDMIVNIINEIYLSIGVIDSQVKHMSWNYHLSQRIGNLDVYFVTASIGKMQIDLEFKIANIIQHIPAVHDRREHCARTGSRRYGFAGPRSRECHTYWVERGINQHESELVYQNLVSKVPEVLALMY